MRRERVRAARAARDAAPAAPVGNRAGAPTVAGQRPEGGERLAAEQRESLAQAFGHRFDDVRIHDDASSDALARELGALALTVGSDIYFRAGAYDSGDDAGGGLLAHEAAHVVQHELADPSDSRSYAPTRVSVPAESQEIAAERAATTARSGAAVHAGSLGSGADAGAAAIHRFSAPDFDWARKTGVDTGRSLWNAAEALPGVGNMLSAATGGVELGVAGLGAATGNDALARSAAVGAEDNLLNAVPLLGNVRAGTEALSDARTAYGDFTGMDPKVNQSAESRWNRSGAAQFNDYADSLARRFFENPLDYGPPSR